MSKKQIKLVPKYRFPEFAIEEEWKAIPLRTIANKVTVKNKDGLVSRVLTNSATDGIVEQKDYFEREIVTQGNISNYFIVSDGDYIYNPRISSSAPVGPVSKNKIGIGIMSPLYTVFRFKDSENDFYEQYFKTNLWNNYLKTIANTGARFDRISISANDFMSMPMPVSSNKEQQKIADCLASIDDLISAEDKKLSALKDHKKGLMQKLFPAEGKTIPEWRFPEFSNSRVWNMKSLSKICINLDAKRIPITGNKRKSGSTPYYGASGIVDYIDGFIFDEYLLCVSEDGANLVARTYPIAFSISGKTWVNNHAHVLKFQNDFTQVLVENYLNHIDLSDYLTGMAQPKLNRAKLDIIPIPLPDEKEQKKIANLLSSVDELITAQTDKTEALKKHKTGLMQGLFPSIEEASR